MSSQPIGLALTDEQAEIRSVARNYLQRNITSAALRAPAVTQQGFDEAVWQQIVELGWPAMCLPESAGGLEFGQIERVLLMEEMGQVLLPAPFLSSAVLAADALVLAGAGDAADELLTRLGEGEVRLALVAAGDLHAGADLANGVQAAPIPGGDWSLSGSGGLALDAATADILLVVARDDRGELGLFATDAAAAGLLARPARLVDHTRQFAQVTLDGVRARRSDDPAGETAEGLRVAVERATVALAAEMIGAAQRCLDMCVEYAADRRQFGVPIGSFQVIKHRCASLAVELDAAREAVLFAAEVLTEGDPREIGLVASAAKLAAGDTFGRAVKDTVQIHGGIGYTDEHDAHLYFKRARTDGRMLGSAERHRRRVAELLDV